GAGPRRTRAGRAGAGNRGVPVAVTGASRPVRADAEGAIVDRSRGAAWCGPGGGVADPVDGTHGEAIVDALGEAGQGDRGARRAQALPAGRVAPRREAG